MNELRITSPCQIGWHTMTPADTGRYCATCDKVVADVASMPVAAGRTFLRTLTERTTSQKRVCVHVQITPQGRLVAGRRKLLTSALAGILASTVAGCNGNGPDLQRDANAKTNTSKPIADITLAQNAPNYDVIDGDICIVHTKLYQIDIAVGMDRQQIEQLVAFVLVGNNASTPSKISSQAGVVQYRHGDWLLEVNYTTGSPATVLGKPDGTSIQLPATDQTVSAFKFIHKNTTVVPPQLMRAFDSIVTAGLSGDLNQLRNFCVPENITITIDPRPTSQPDFGQDINIPFMKNGFTQQVVLISKQSDSEYLIRTDSTAMWFEKSADGIWLLSKYLDKPIE